METYITVLISSVATLFATVTGVLIGNKLSKDSAITNDLRTFITDAYAKVTAEYLLFLDGQAQRSDVIAAIRRALFLCEDDMKAPLKALEASVLKVRDVYNDDISKCGPAFSAFMDASKRSMEYIWSKKFKYTKRNRGKSLGKR